MGLVDRVNKWVLGRLKGRLAVDHVDVQTEALIVQLKGGDHLLIGWREISRVAALTKPAMVPSDLRVLVVEWKGQRVELSEDIPGWDRIPAALDQYVRGAIPSARWLLRLQAAPRNAISIYEKSGGLN